MMIQTKTFLKKNRRGNILKIVREHYLRDDLSCGSQLCSVCTNEKNSPATLQAELSDSAKLSSIVSCAHYIIPDVSVWLNQIEVFSCGVIQNVIVLKTVLDAICRTSLSLYRKLTDLLSNPDSTFYFFINDFHINTYSERVSGETQSDYDDRMVYVATRWYATHLPQVKFVLLTDSGGKCDHINKTERCWALTVTDYVRSLPSVYNLIDKLSIANTDSIVTPSIGDFVNYPEHLSLSSLLTSIRLSKYRQGRFTLCDDNYLQGYVEVDGFGSILIQGRMDINRAVHNDTVAVELYVDEKWRAPVNITLIDAGFDTDHHLHDEMLVAKSSQSDVVPTGKIVGIVKRRWKRYCGVLQLSPVSNDDLHLFVPSNTRVPLIFINTSRAEHLKSRRIVCAIDSWPRTSKYPLGHFCDDLGALGSKEAENEVILLEQNVPHESFSKAVTQCLPSLPYLISDQEVSRRVDFRHLDICSVDPPRCTDIDDALHCRQLSNGNFEVGVHIADVSHFVHHGTALDQEAFHRSTTVYLVDKRIDMIPELLSSNICSLRSGEDRLAFSCVWEITGQAEIVDTKFCKSVIRSRHAFMYSEAQLKIDDLRQTDSLAVSLRHLNELAKHLKKRRINDGAVLLASPEIRFFIDSETNDPTDVMAKQALETHSMVEEFMLLANVSVAQKILREFPECALLRRHPDPELSNFAPLIKAARLHGFELDCSSNKSLQISLDQARIGDNDYFNTMIRIMATRCMNQAVYICSGKLSPDLYKHYGLATPIYTHFTSPIRRYADIIVHRLLAVVVGQETTYPELLDKSRTHNLVDHINFRHRMAQYAQRASIGLHTHLFFREQCLDEQAYILGVKSNSITVIVPRFGLESTIMLPATVKDNSQTQFVYDESVPCHTAHGISLKVFDKLLVQLSVRSRSVQQRALVMELVLPHFPGFSVTALDCSMETESHSLESQQSHTQPTSHGKRRSRNRDKRRKRSERAITE